MMTIWGRRARYCDGLSRRSFLHLGGLALGSLAVPRANRADDAHLARGSHKAVIMVYLSGGMAHQDTFDLKPDAPSEVRGEFKPISTAVPGVQICELLPKLACMMDKLALIRSIVGQRDEHSSFHTLTGFPMDVAQREGRPNFGSSVARIHGPTGPVIPPFVDLFPVMQHRPYNSPGPGFLGDAYRGVTADGENLASMKLRYVSSDQFRGRRELLASFDAFRRTIDQAPLDQMDAARQRAFEVLTSSKLVEAIDLEREDPALRDRYGRGSPEHQGDGAPLFNDHLLMARRLVEAGVRVVTVAYGFWDTHGNNFGHLRNNLPRFDQGISALVEDLHARGLDRDVCLIVWGEFGRTPKINADAGRDHWAPVNGALVAGGGLRTGQVIGATDKLAGYALDRPVHFQDVLATLYHVMEIDPHMLVRDVTERPIPILPASVQPIRELI